MSVRVVARIRPLSKSELEKDCIISTTSSADDSSGRSNIVKIPNPRNASESYSFQFQSVYGHETNQQELFDNESELDAPNCCHPVAYLKHSIGDCEVFIQWIGCHNIRIRLHGLGEDTYHERRKDAGRSGDHTAFVEQCAPQGKKNRKRQPWNQSSGNFDELL